MYQQSRINTDTTAREAKDDARRAKTDILLIQNQIESLALTSQAMWELLRDNTKLTEKDIERKIGEIDLRDGRGDGKIGNSILKCENCNRNVSSTRRHCLFCGHQQTKDHVFDVS